MNRLVDSATRPGSVPGVDTPTGFRERLAAVVAEAKRRGTRQYEIEEEAGIGKGQLTHLLTGSRGKDVSAGVLLGLARALGVRAEWLLLGQEPMRHGDLAPLRHHPDWATASASIEERYGLSAEAIERVGDAIMPGAPKVLTPHFIVAIARAMADAAVEVPAEPAQETPEQKAHSRKKGNAP